MTTLRRALGVGENRVAAISPALGTRLAAVRAASARSDSASDAARSRRVSGAGTRIVTGYVSGVDQNADCRGSKWYGSSGTLGIAQKMLRDAHVRQSLAAIYSPLLSAAWRFRPASDSPLDREIAAFCQWAFVDRLPWLDILKRIILDYGSCGFALVEMTDDAAAVSRDRFALHPGGGVGIVPTGLHQIAPWSVYGWEQDTSDPARIAAVVQHVQGSDGETPGWRTIAADRILRWTWDQDAANYEGMAVLRSAYGAWKMKMAFQAIAAIKHERLAVPTPVAIASEDATDDDVRAVEAVLEEMRSNQRGYAVFDSGWTFSWQGASTSSGSNVEAAIAACNAEIAYNVSAGFMLLGLQGGGGSYALGATQQGQYHLAEKAHARFLERGWNLGCDGWSPVRRIVELNYGVGVSMPSLEARNLPTAPWQDRIPILINAANVGLVRRDARLESAIREALEFDPFDAETELPGRAPVELVPDERDRITDQDPIDAVEPEVDDESDYVEEDQ